MVKIQLPKLLNLQKHNKLAVLILFIIAVFAIIGFIFSMVFIGMQFGVFNVRGSIDNRNKFFTESGDNSSPTLINKIQLGFRESMKSVRKSVFPDISFAWIDTNEWQTLSFALTKDKEVIRKVAEETSVSPRILVAVVIAEQIRFFTSERESYKKFFEPLKVLGTLSQFSLGVSGIKPETAKLIEDNLKNPSSPFYISKEYEHMLDYKVDEGDVYSRLTDEHNHYYSYLYTALFIKEIEAQWSRAGFDISNRPEILATIFNLGFDKSIPKKDPEVAGSVIDIAGEKISFGRLAYEFYYSGELLDIFGF